MKRRLSIKRLFINFMLALFVSVAIAPMLGVAVLPMALGIVVVSATAQYFAPNLFKGALMEGLQTEVWVAGIKENPIPNHSFVAQSVDMSEYVENNKLHLAEAGIEPAVHENYFEGNEDPLPVANIEDIGNEVLLKTYSTEQTRHRQLQEVELQYDRRASIIKRHRISLAKNMGKRAAYAWSPQQDNEFNKVLNLKETDSIIDGIIDIKAFLGDFDVLDGINICLNSAHMARIRKEDKKLYKEILNEKVMYGLNVFQYSQNPLYTSAGVKKPFGATAESGDKRASFVWVSDEVFRCFGDVEMYANLRDSGIQADTLSFAQRALTGAIRAKNPKYFGAIL